MPSPTAVLGWAYDVYLPDNDDRMDLGYTAIKVYYATTEGGSYSLAGSVTLVAGAYEGTRPPSPPPDSWASKAESDVAIWTLAMAAGSSPEVRGAGVVIGLACG